MSGYATTPRHLQAIPSQQTGTTADTTLIDALIARLADEVAARLSQQVNAPADDSDEWFDSRHAAEYMGVHRDTLRKLAAERSIPSEQDGPGCKLYFRRSDLDAWRHNGGRPRHLASAA
jgi:excisionase family DNA binding protein